MQYQVLWRCSIDKRRLIVGIVSIAYIVYMWVKKDIVAIYTTMTLEQALPLIVTTVAVSLIKLAAIAGVILLIKLIFGKVHAVKSRTDTIEKKTKRHE